MTGRERGQSLSRAYRSRGTTISNVQRQRKHKESDRRLWPYKAKFQPKVRSFWKEIVTNDWEARQDPRMGNRIGQQQAGHEEVKLQSAQTPPGTVPTVVPSWIGRYVSEASFSFHIKMIVSILCPVRLSEH